MYKGKYSRQPAGQRRSGSKRTGAMVLSLFLLLSLTIGGTLAYLTASTTDVKNIFQPSEVTCEVTEEFDGTYKKNVNVTNTSEIDAYVRVKLLTYRLNEKGEYIGGVTTVGYRPPADSGWQYNAADGMYYYLYPVAPKQPAGKPLVGEEGIVLQNYELTFYTDPSQLTGAPEGSELYGIKTGDMDGGKQVVEVIAEAIQAKGADVDGGPAVTNAWGVGVAEDGSLVINVLPELQ